MPTDTWWPMESRYVICVDGADLVTKGARKGWARKPFGLTVVSAFLPTSCQFRAGSNLREESPRKTRALQSIATALTSPLTLARSPRIVRLSHEPAQIIGTKSLWSSLLIAHENPLTEYLRLICQHERQHALPCHHPSSQTYCGDSYDMDTLRCVEVFDACLL